VIHVSELPKAGIACEPLTVSPHELRKVNAADLLLPLDDELDPAWKVPVREQRVECEQASALSMSATRSAQAPMPRFCAATLGWAAYRDSSAKLSSRCSCM
jgi:hypothetical protein